MPDISASSWNESDPLNNATPPTGWPEGQMPSTVNDCARMMMGGLKRWWNRANPTISATGSSGAYAYATSNTLFPTAYQQGETYSFKAPFTSVGGDTFVVNALTALPIYSRTGSGTLSAIAAGDIQSSTYITLAYDSALNAGAGGFQLVNGGGTAPINNPTFGGTVTTPTINVSGTGNIQNLVVPGTSTQTGAVSMGTTLHVAGASTLSGGLSVTGNESVSGNENVGGTLTAGTVIGNGSVQSNGVYFQNNSGWFYTPQNFFAGGVVGVSGSTSIYWQNNGGWMYTPVGMWSANINTGSINMNGAALSGCGNIAGASVGSIGGVSMPGGGQINSGNINCGSIYTNGQNVNCGSLNTGNISCGQINSGAIVTGGSEFDCGNIVPVSDGGYGCGFAGRAWSGVESYAFYNASSATLKDEIATIDSAACVAAVERLRPVTFRYKDIADEATHCGFIAEEVLASLDAVGIDACVKRDGERLSLAYQELIPLLLGTVQALSKRLEALEAR